MPDLVASRQRQAAVSRTTRGLTKSSSSRTDTAGGAESADSTAAAHRR
jgi:hypothetical protein